MTLQIVSERVEGGLRIQLHGRLSRPEVAELQAACASPTPHRIHIDLEHLSGASAEGILALKDLQASGAHLDGASPYIALLLGGRPAAADHTGRGPGRAT